MAATAAHATRIQRAPRSSGREGGRHLHLKLRSSQYARSKSLWCNEQRARPLSSSSGPSKVNHRTCAASMPALPLPAARRSHRTRLAIHACSTAKRHRGPSTLIATTTSRKTTASPVRRRRQADRPRRRTRRPERPVPRRNRPRRAGGARSHDGRTVQRMPSAAATLSTARRRAPTPHATQPRKRIRRARAGRLDAARPAMSASSPRRRPAAHGAAVGQAARATEPAALCGERAHRWCCRRPRPAQPSVCPSCPWGTRKA